MVRGTVDAFDCGNGESTRFARSGAAASDQIASLEKQGDGACLDIRGLGIADLVDRSDDV